MPVLLVQLTTCDYFTASSSTFLDSCNFESENICGMIQSHENANTASWQRVSKAEGGPETDYTNMERCDGKSCWFIIFKKIQYILYNWEALKGSFTQKLNFSHNLLTLMSFQCHLALLMSNLAWQQWRFS